MPYLLHKVIFFFYNTEMHAIIPHKDCLFFLSSAAGKIILSMNQQLGEGDFFVPVFPLWAFTEAPVEKIRSFSVLSPESDGREIFFSAQTWVREKQSSSEDCLRSPYLKGGA